MKAVLAVVVSVVVVMGVAGCNVSKPYITETDRTDQKMDLGNQGYLKGTPPPAEDRTNLKRQIINVDIEFPKLGSEKAGYEGKEASSSKGRSENIK